MGTCMPTPTKNTITTPTKRFNFKGAISPLVYSGNPDMAEFCVYIMQQISKAYRLLNTSTSSLHHINKAACAIIDDCYVNIDNEYQNGRINDFIHLELLQEITQFRYLYIKPSYV